MRHTSLDVSRESGILITCRSCTWWYAFRFDHLEAHDAAVDHEARVHPGATGAAAARAMYVKQHAA